MRGAEDKEPRVGLSLALGNGPLRDREAPSRGAMPARDGWADRSTSTLRCCDRSFLLSLHLQSRTERSPTRRERQRRACRAAAAPPWERPATERCVQGCRLAPVRHERWDVLSQHRLRERTGGSCRDAWCGAVHVEIRRHLALRFLERQKTATR